MNLIKLSTNQQKELLRQPESGMGWQRVDVELTDGRRLENCIVRNAEVLDVPEPLDPCDIQAIDLHEGR